MGKQRNEQTIQTLLVAHPPSPLIVTQEVAAWAILDQIWEVFYLTICGVADSGEILVAKHLGDGESSLAKLSAYKALVIGMCIAVITSVVYFSLQDTLPGWFTHDDTLISMLRELVPFVGVANLR